MKDQLHAAMEDISKLNAEGVVVRGNKKYTTVAVRIEVFRKHFPDYSVNTRVTVDDAKRVIVVAEIYPPNSDRPVATGIAEEIRGSSNVNKTSAIENGETSAIGRALANLGLHGGEFASDFEIEVAQLKDAKIELNTAEKKAAEKKPKDPPKEDPEEADILETLRDDSDVFGEDPATKCAQWFIEKFERAKSVERMNIIFKENQKNYLSLKKLDESAAAKVKAFYELREEQILNG
tara:strand:+ start:2280 stop:2984 length:705 start_codon:yes stop_codon:yes gene_type:complete